MTDQTPPASGDAAHDPFAYRCNGPECVAARDAALTPPPAEPTLDVERLDRAMARAGVHVDAARPGPEREVGCGSCAPGIARIAAEYARLAASPEGAPE